MLISLLIQSSVLFLITLVLTNYFIKVAPRLSLVDIPNNRSSHKIETPRGAGIVFGFVFIVGFNLFNYDLIADHLLTVLAILIVYLTGIYDDLKDMKSRTKFLWVILATLLLYFDGLEISSIGTFFGYEITLGILALPFTIFAVVGFTNAVNLTDGLDGLASSISIVILSSLVYVGYLNNDEFLIYGPALLISVLLAFLVFNWNPAKVFMGDSGSLILGFIISIFAIKALNYIDPVAVLFLGGMPLLDTLVVIRRRRQRGISPFVADKNHLHHILYKYKLDKKFTVRMLIYIQSIFSLIFIQVLHADSIVTLALFTLLYIIFFNLFDPRTKIRYSKKKKKRKKKAKYIDILKRKNIEDEN